MVSGDVFRAPKDALLLCVQVGSGVQIVTSASITLVFAALGGDRQRCFWERWCMAGWTGEESARARCNGSTCLWPHDDVGSCSCTDSRLQYRPTCVWWLGGAASGHGFSWPSLGGPEISGAKLCRWSSLRAASGS
jgi:Endomembrane protein 70